MRRFVRASPPRGVGRMSLPTNHSTIRGSAAVEPRTSDVLWADPPRCLFQRSRSIPVSARKRMRGAARRPRLSPSIPIILPDRSRSQPRMRRWRTALDFRATARFVTPCYCFASVAAQGAKRALDNARHSDLNLVAHVEYSAREESRWTVGGCLVVIADQNGAKSRPDLCRDRNHRASFGARQICHGVGSVGEGVLLERRG